MRKKIGLWATLFLLIAAMLTTLCGCNGAGWERIKSSYSKAGYKEAEELDAYSERLDSVKQDFPDGEYAVHIMVKGESMAIILEFASEEDLVKNKSWVDYQIAAWLQTQNHVTPEEVEAHAFEILQQHSNQVNGLCVLASFVLGGGDPFYKAK